MGGGGRGMRVVHDAAQLDSRLEEAQGEARSAFAMHQFSWKNFYLARGISKCRFLRSSRQFAASLGARLFRTAASQKVVEVAPAANLPVSVRAELCEAALRIARKANYRNAGTVEFLYDVDAGKWYFIEVNRAFRSSTP